jgi:hypothetical protein
MMSKWADYGISAVRFNLRHTHIDQLQVTQDQGDTFGANSIESRDNVVSAIKRGVKFITIYRGENNQWNKGQPVVIDRVNGVDFLKTVPNGKPIDNLDNLPEI